MLRSDAQQQSNDINNIMLLTMEMVSQIEKEIDVYDLVSLVFLLYDVPDTALQRLTVYQRVSKDIGSCESNLLLDWASHAQTRPTWKKELLEALYTCQLHSIISKMGISVDAVKRYYTASNDALLNPMKKSLYRLCESINKENLHKLKKTLISYDIDTTDHETCEMILLDLMSKGFITINMNSSKTVTSIENLAKIIDQFKGFHIFANELRHIECNFKSKSKLSSPLTSTLFPIVDDKQQHVDNGNNKPVMNLEELFSPFENLDMIYDIPDEHITSDTKALGKDVYAIINPKRVGICLIINQEIFHPSKHSIESKSQAMALDNRQGSTKDKELLMQTMRDLNFDVIAHDNLDHVEMLKCIKNVIKNMFRKDHSMFMLCILSHGTRGHVFAADSVKIKVEDIESLFDSNDAIHLRNKPKLMILQACQTNDNEDPLAHLVADSPSPRTQYHIKKSDILIYWATVPNYEAYRHDILGSIFIQMLCPIIKKHSKKEDIHGLLTKVNQTVNKICVNVRRDQQPKVEHTLLKKLYLQIPNA